MPETPSLRIDSDHRETLEDCAKALFFECRLPGDALWWELGPSDRRRWMEAVVVTGFGQEARS